MGKKVCLCRRMNGEFLIGNKEPVRVVSVPDEKRKRIKKGVILGAMAGAVLWGLYYGITVKPSSEIIVPHYLCDYVDKPLLYLEPEETEGKEVPGYVDGNMPMVSFEGGAIVQIEYYRGMVCRILYGACLGAALTGAAGYGKYCRALRR